MWELIQSNKRKSVGLIVLLATLLMALGWAIGYIWMPDGGPYIGTFIAMIVWVVMIIIAFAGGEKVLLATAGARETSPQDAPQLHNIVEEMQIASGLPVKPKVYIINSDTPNAFAVGLKPERAAVAVTTGLMARLSRDELQGVIAHELGHINNRDTMFMTLAGVTVGAIIIIADLFLRGMWYSSGRRRRSSRNEGQAAVIMLIVSIVLAILAPLLAQMLYFACSRRREYLADASAAMYTRYPEGLASALAKISGMQGGNRKEVSRALAPMYIVNPLAAAGRSKSLFSTHPPIVDRIKVLRNMTSDSSLAAYEQAYQSLHKDGVVGTRSLRDSAQAPIREGSKAAPGSQKKQWRDAKDALHNADRYFMLACLCGMKLKIPPDYHEKNVKCPRCGTNHALPPELLAAAVGLEAAAGYAKTPKASR